MEFKLNNLLPDNWLHALGLTLFHSLWLGIVLAMLSALIVFFTKKSSAAVRSNLLTFCLALFVAGVLIVFYKLVQLPVSTSNINLSDDQISVWVSKSDHTNVVLDTRISLPNILTRILSFWNRYAYEIVSIWFLVICFKGIQFSFGLSRIHQLRNQQVFKAGNLLEEELKSLIAELEIRQEVKLLQSSLVQVPMAIGHLKPLILIPIGLLNGLSAAEAEAILAHELAHIKRRDYFVNLLQSFIEIVFFFNPAVLWVSNLIKTEREHCCDDLAISCVSDRKNYVQALISCQEFKQRAPAYAMAINGGKNSLLHRASRMLFNTKSTLNKMEKTILTITMVTVVLCLAAFRNVTQAKSTTVTKTHVERFQRITDTAKKVVRVAKVQKDKSKEKSPEKLPSVYQMEEAIEKRMDSAELALSKNNKAFDAEERKFAAREARWKQDEEKRALADRKWAEEDKRWAQEDTRRNEENQKINKTRSNLKRAYSSRSVSDRGQGSITSTTSVYNSNGEGFITPPTPPTPQTPQAYGGQTPPTPPTPPSPPRGASSFYGTFSGTTRDKNATGSIGINRGTAVTAATSKNGGNETILLYNELIKDGLLKEGNNGSYKLSYTEMVINGLKQSESVHEKYKKKYLKSEKHSMYYNYETSSTTTVK